MGDQNGGNIEHSSSSYGNDENESPVTHNSGAASDDLMTDSVDV
jgi:hypothetical protein